MTKSSLCDFTSAIAVVRKQGILYLIVTFLFVCLFVRECVLKDYFVTKLHSRGESSDKKKLYSLETKGELQVSFT